MAEKYGFSELLEIMRVLRGENGCEWDKAQTHESIRTNVLEEAYEVLDAIESGDKENLKEELGDLLLQSVFHAEIEKSAGGFGIDEVLDGLCKKLVSRHPHVFGGEKAENAKNALAFWEQAKKKEKKQGGLADELKALPKTLPETLRAVKIGKKAAKAGLGGGVDLALCAEAAAENFGRLENGENAEETIGEILYAVCTAARLSGVDPEVALRRVNGRNILLAEKIEALSGKPISELTEMEVEEYAAKAVYEK